MGPAYLMYSNKDSNAESEFMAARPSESSFLQLPVEIRLEIYRYLLSSKYIRRKIPYQGGRFETTYYIYPFHKQILRTNRQVHREAIYFFQVENLFLRFTTNHPVVRHILWESQGLLFLTHGDRAGSFRRCAMEINHDCDQAWTADDHQDCNCTQLNFTTCLLISDQLPNLLRTLRAYSQQGDQCLAKSSFSAHVFYEFDQSSTATQPDSPSVHPGIRTLLDPFKILYGAVSLDIKGRVNREYKHSIVSSATQSEPTVADIITAALAITTRGDEAFRTHHFDLALSLYTSAFNEFHVNRHWAAYTGYLSTGEYAAMSTAHAVRRFKIMIQSHLAAALVQVGEYRRATDFAREAIRQIITRETPEEEWRGLYITGANRAKPFLWGGLAYEGLGDLDRALYGVGEALAHYPENERLARDYRRLEGEIERRGIEPAVHEFGRGRSWYAG